MSAYIKGALASWAFFYLCIAFVRWEIDWVFGAANWSGVDRFAFLFFYLFFCGAFGVVAISAWRQFKKDFRP